MKIHYYSGWFGEALPKKMAELLRHDITNRKSIAIIWGWYIDEPFNIVKDVLLDPIGIVFDEYYFIDSQTPKEKAHETLRNASVILLMGGYTTIQNTFLMEYELALPIKESSADVIVGFSAGAKNMATKCVCVKSNGYLTEKNGIYIGIGLDNFGYEPYFSLDNDELIRDELLPMSQKLDIYATSTGSFIRVKGSNVMSFGDTYLISCSKIQKVESR